MPYDPQILYEWSFPEYHRPDRPAWWYWAAGTIFLVVLLVSLFTNNFLFAVILVMFVIIFFIQEKENPIVVSCVITDEGVEIDNVFYDYDEIQNFFIIYKPGGIKNLYFHFKASLKPNLPIPLRDEDPVEIREILLKYLKEDLEKKDISPSEWLASLLRL